MIPVDQDRFGADGNCFAACVASIFEVALHDVPQPETAHLTSCEGWAGYLEIVRRDFLEPRGYYCLTLPAFSLEGHAFTPPGVAIMGTRSPRTGGGHAVVVYHGRIVHDPHPQRAMGVGDPEEWTVFVAIDPKTNFYPPEK